MEDGMNRVSIGIVNNAHRLIDNPWITRCLNSERNGHGSRNGPCGSNYTNEAE